MTVEELIKSKPRTIPIRPRFLEARVYKIKAETRSWYVSISHNDENMPLEVFVYTNSRDSSAQLKDAVPKLERLAVHYEVDEEFVEDQRQKAEHQTNTAKFCRILSLCLRHNVSLEDILDILDSLEHNVSNLTWHIHKLLSYYVKEKGDNILSVCPSCKENGMSYEGGCKVCQLCGWAAC